MRGNGGAPGAPQRAPTREAGADARRPRLPLEGARHVDAARFDECARKHA
ncbi:MAG: hypothetical protein WCK05_12755 [Planctomycetota bacterium]